MQFPHASIPLTFQDDHQTAQFMEDMRLTVSTIHLLGEGLGVYVGNGSPEGVLAARVGSLYLRKDGGLGATLYVKELGSATSSGWRAK